MMFEGLPDRKWRPDERRVNKMVFIGKDLSREDFEEAFKSCIVSKEVENKQALVA
jgi:G3E family GTPase